MSATSEHDHVSLLAPAKLLGETFDERMRRFGLIVENAYHNWDLSDRDENAIRTANAVLAQATAQIAALRAEREIGESYLRKVVGDRNRLAGELRNFLDTFDEYFAYRPRDALECTGLKQAMFSAATQARAALAASKEGT